MRRHPFRRILVLGVILVAASCGGLQEEVATKAVDQSTTQSTTKATAAPPSATVSPTTTSTTVAEVGVELPDPGEPWDLLFFGFDDVLTEAVAERYTELAVEALGVEVTLLVPQDSITSGLQPCWRSCAGIATHRWVRWCRRRSSL